MRETEKKKPISTIPRGVWEAGRPENNDRKTVGKLSETTDLQGNGYPGDLQGKRDSAKN